MFFQFPAAAVARVGSDPNPEFPLHLSRRSLIIGSTATLIASQAGPARADFSAAGLQFLRYLQFRHWRGQGTTPAPGMVEGEFTVGLDYDFKELTSDLTFDGEYKVQSNIDGNSYLGTFYMAGHWFGSDYDVTLRIDSSHFLYGSQLRSGMYWQGLMGDLHLYRNREQPDHWLLKGDLRGTQDGAIFETHLTDAY